MVRSGTLIDWSMNKLEIIRQICDYNMSTRWRSKARTRQTVFERAVFFKLCRVLTKESLSDIGKMTGRDHATVVHGLKVFENDIEPNDGKRKKYHRYYELYVELLKKCNGAFTDLNNGPLGKRDMMLHENINLRADNDRLKKRLKGLSKLLLK